MSKLKSISLMLTAGMASLFVSVFLFGQTANAQEIEQQEEVKLNIFIAEPMLEEQNLKVFEKLTEVEKEAKEKEEIENKKKALDGEVKSLKEQLEELKQKVADKKATEARAVAAEKARLAELARQAATQPTATTSTATQATVTRGSSSGNTYGYGYCTWFVKNMRGGSLPNGLGNANTWFYRARAQGMAVGTTPRVGAVGTTERGALGHVVYVTAVHGDGTITISEMNYRAWNVASSRTANASEFRYIY